MALTKKLLTSLLVAGTAVTAVAVDAHAEDKVINLYSYRQPFLIKPLIDKFSAETGIKVNVVFAEKGMLEKIKAAGANNPADVALTVDIGRLYELKTGGVLEAVKSDVLNANVPANLRDPDGQWYGLTTRARIAMVSKERIKEGDLQTYEDLANPKYKGKICIRSGKHAYNIAMIAAMIAHHGEAKTEEWLKGLKANLARKPQGNDRAQAKAIYEGVCDIALVNTYYMGAMMTNDKSPEQKEWANAVRITFLNQGAADRGQHVNISGAGLLKGAKHRAEAVKLLEWLSSDEAQHIYAEVNNEYPANPKVPASELVKSWGSFKVDPLSLEDIAKLRGDASKLVDKVNFDEGPTS